MAEFFRILTNNVFNIFFGIKPDGQSKYTVPLEARKPGLLGKCTGAFGVIEEQARGTPHCHAIVWGSLTPSLLQAATPVPQLREAIIKLLDRMVTAELTIKTMAEHLLNQFPGGERPTKPALNISHNPVADPVAFSFDFQHAASVANIHSHSHTCHKGKQGKKGCRLCRPAPAADSTHVVQLLPTPDPEKKTSYTVTTEFTDRHNNSLPGRDFSDVPVAARDSNLYCYELQRRDHKLYHDGIIDDDEILEVTFSKSKSFT